MRVRGRGPCRAVPVPVRERERSTSSSSAVRGKRYFRAVPPVISIAPSLSLSTTGNRLVDRDLQLFFSLVIFANLALCVSIFFPSFSRFSLLLRIILRSYLFSIYPSLPFPRFCIYICILLRNRPGGCLLGKEYKCAEPGYPFRPICTRICKRNVIFAFVSLGVPAGYAGCAVNRKCLVTC